MWRRVRLIPFEVQIPEAGQDRHLGQKIKAVELPGVLNWLLEGCLAWQREGLKPPRTVVSATADYREEQDILGRFIEDACEVNPGATVPGTDLYAAYTCWCHDAGERPVTLREFNARLDERGRFARDRGERGVRWHGLSVRAAYLPLSQVIARGGRS